jgi:flagellar biosynthesis protein FlhG
MEHRSKARSAPSGLSRTVVITSGKGGVGKSNVALNLAIALAQAGKPVLLLDVNFGVGTIELLCGLNSPWNLSHVISGEMRLEEILIEGPEGVMILPGAGSLGETNREPSSLENVLTQLATLRMQFPFTIVDLGTGLARLMDRFVTTSASALMVTTTEPPSLAEAYALIKSYPSPSPVSWEVLINQAESRAQAERIFQSLSHTTRAFLQIELAFAGWIPESPHVPKAVRARSPFLLEHPHSVVSQSLRNLAQRLLDPENDFHAITHLSHSHNIRHSNWARAEAPGPVAAW